MEENRSARDRELDETLEETFPASDAPANTVETGIRVGPVPLSPVVTDNREAQSVRARRRRSDCCFSAYQRTPAALVLVHTEVPPSLRGRHLADALARAAIGAAHAEALQVVADCPFVKAYLRKHPSRDPRPEKGIP